MMYVTVIYQNLQGIQELRVLSFSSEFELDQFMNECESQTTVITDESYLKIQVWIQQDMQFSNQIFERVFHNGSSIFNPKDKKIRTSSILQFPMKSLKG